MSVRRIALILLVLAGFSLGAALAPAERAFAEAVVISDVQQQPAEPSNLKLAQVTTASSGPRASESDMAAIRSAAELVRAKKAGPALAKLEPLAGRLAGNPDFDYVYGVAQLDSGHPAQAAEALRRALKARPDFALARAELGRALAAMGDLSGAKREFEAVRNAPGVPPVARDAMGRQVTAIDQVAVAAAKQAGQPGQPGQPAQAGQAGPTGTRVTGYIESSIGYDTNVNGGPASSTLLIPALSFLGPATILPSALPKKAGFYEIAAGLSIVHPLSNDVALFANLAGNYHPLFDHEEFRTAQAGGEAGVARQIQGLGIFSFAAIGQTFLMGDNVFRNIFGLAGQWRQKLAEVWDTSLALSWLRLEYPSQIGMDTNRYTVTGALGRRFDTPLKPAISLTVNVGKELAITDGNDFLSFTLLGVRGGLEASFWPNVVTFAQAGYEVHRHDADYPLFFTHRHDDIYEVLGGFDIKLSDKMTLRPSVRYSETRSNVDIFDQKRWISQTALRWTF